MGWNPCSASLACTASVFSARLMPWFKAATAASGVPAAQYVPNWICAANPGNPLSATVGMSGYLARRSWLVTASTRSRPLLR
ncbi:hypothetical protein D3C85_1647610 [compost metagenome]